MTINYNIIKYLKNNIKLIDNAFDDRDFEILVRYSFDNIQGMDVEDISKECGQPVHLNRIPPYEIPANQLVVSWDAKVTLSTQDVQLLQTVGDANHTPLSDIWRVVCQ